MASWRYGLFFSIVKLYINNISVTRSMFVHDGFMVLLFILIDLPAARLAVGVPGEELSCWSEGAG